MVVDLSPVSFKQLIMDTIFSLRIFYYHQHFYDIDIEMTINTVYVLKLPYIIVFFYRIDVSCMTYVYFVCGLLVVLVLWISTLNKTLNWLILKDTKVWCLENNDIITTCLTLKYMFEEIMLNVVESVKNFERISSTLKVHFCTCHGTV